MVPTLCSGADPIKRQEIKERNTKLDEVLRPLTYKVYEVKKQSKQELDKQGRYCQEQCEVLRALEDLAAKERTMYELDNRKDQVMTTFKVALANLAMWVRDQYFPASYDHATWHRLLPFFQLPGTITRDVTTIQVELRPFNDRALAILRSSVNASIRFLLVFLMDVCSLLPSAPHVAFYLRKKEPK